jgi:histidine ammonia-lyase
MDNTLHKYSSTFVRDGKRNYTADVWNYLMKKLIFRNVGFFDKKMATHSEPIYGINGFGSLCNVKISNENLSKLQENLVKHACGTGRRKSSN